MDKMIGKTDNITRLISLEKKEISMEILGKIYMDIISIDPSYSYSYKRIAEIQKFSQAEISRRRAAVAGGDDVSLLIDYAKDLSGFWLNEHIPEKRRLDTTNELCPYSKMTTLTAVLRRVLELEPNNANALALLGGAMRIQWKLKDSEKQLTRSSHISGLDEESLLNRIRLYYRSGDLIAAERSCIEAIRENSDRKSFIEALKTIRSDLDRMQKISAILSREKNFPEKDDTPIIFVHYGYNNYLATTMASAILTNPGKRVILIGDESNKIFSSIGVEHYDFNTINDGPEIQEFERIWKFIPTWDVQYQPEFFKFVFKKWYFINRFVEMNGISSFWHFDSDTMIMDDISILEKTLSQYDCTEQVGGRCMGGLIANRKAVQAYVASMNDDLKAGVYLDDQNTGAYNEMDAYIRFRNANPWLRSFNLSEVHEGKMYEAHALGPSTPGEDFESEDGKKKFLTDSQGNVYRKKLSTNENIRIYAINMSWSLIESYEHMINQVIIRNSRKNK